MPFGCDSAARAGLVRCPRRFVHDIRISQLYRAASGSAAVWAEDLEAGRRYPLRYRQYHRCVLPIKFGAQLPCARAYGLS